jgi:hypothetical protein
MSECTQVSEEVKHQAAGLGYGVSVRQLPDGLSWIVAPEIRQVLVSPEVGDVAAAAGQAMAAIAGN